MENTRGLAICAYHRRTTKTRRFAAAATMAPYEPTLHISRIDLPTILCAPDKFKGTAEAGDLARAAAEMARSRGWTVRLVTMADGGEGLLSVVDGERMVTEVTGPLGQPVNAEWSLLRGEHRRPGLTAVIEMAQAAGLVLAGGPSENRPLEATTRGVGELVLAALNTGATDIIVGCGGSATTDGGLAAVEAIGKKLPASGVTLTVACDVTTKFGDAARVFGPQKGAGPVEVTQLAQRLDDIAAFYRQQFDFDVTGVPRAGAAGGLAGGLAVLGAKLVSGFDLVADLIGLDDELRRSDLCVTGEGRLDVTTTAGKVVGELARRCEHGPELWCIVGSREADVDERLLFGAHVVSLTERFGEASAMAEPALHFAEVTGEAIDTFEAWHRASP